MILRQIHSTDTFATTPRRKGVTLVELLVVMVIITILASLALTSLYMAQLSAREQRTKGTIAKIHRLIMGRLELYRSRPLPVSMAEIIANLNNNSITTINGQTFDLYNPQHVAEARLLALREMQRMEMPESWSDIANKSYVLGQRTALAQRLLIWARNAGKISADLSQVNPDGTVIPDIDGFNNLRYESAMCLHMILQSSVPGAPNAADLFRSDEEGLWPFLDTTGAINTSTKKFKVFRQGVYLDGWGTPIGYIRWPAGAGRIYDSNNKPICYEVSDLQPDVKVKSDTELYFDPTRHDPMDMQLTQPNAFAIYPLVYSAGADKSYGVWRSDDGYGLCKLYPFASMFQGAGRIVGGPVPEDDPAFRAFYGDEADNITNHYLQHE